jgi:hypothetical protein
MQESWPYILETRVWAFLFVALAIFGIPYRLASERCKKRRDRLWRPLIAFAEILSAFSVVGIFALTAQHFVKQELDNVREEANQARHQRQGDAFLMGLNACSRSSFENSSFREISAMAILCTLSKDLATSKDALLDESLAALNRLGPLPIDSRPVLMPPLKMLAKSLQKELDANKRLHFLGLKARSRPLEHDYALLAVAAGVLVGASLKCSRAFSEWRHGCDEG